MPRLSRKTLLRTALSFLALRALPSTSAEAARSARSKLRFSESFGDVRTRENVTQEGRLQVEVVMPLTGVSLKKFDAETAFFFGLGNVTMAGALGDDPRYRRGKKSIHVRDGGRDLRLEWNRRRLLLTLTIATKRGEPGAFAETYMPSPDGPIAGDALSFTSFGGKESRLEITYEGEKSTRNGLRNVRLKGGGDTECGCN